MFKEKIAVVTGGTGELGRIIVERLAREEIKVYVPARSVEKFGEIFDSSKMPGGEEGFKLRRIYCLHCDSAREDDVRDFVGDVLKQEGKIDYLVNTVGGYHAKKDIVNMESSLVENMLELNFKSTFYFCKYVLKSMIDRNFGRITAMGAMPAIEISSGKLAYSVSKSAVVNLIQTIAEETKGNDIAANVIIPSIIDTPANRKSMPGGDFSKWVKPEDVAETILFLLSDAAKSFRGSLIKMYGAI